MILLWVKALLVYYLKKRVLCAPLSESDMIHMVQMPILCFRGVSLKACNVRAMSVSAPNFEASCKVNVTVITP